MNRSLRIVKQAAVTAIGGFAAVALYATAAAATETPPEEIPAEEPAEQADTEQRQIEPVEESNPSEPAAESTTNSDRVSDENQPQVDFSASVENLPSDQQTDEPSESEELDSEVTSCDADQEQSCGTETKQTPGGEAPAVTAAADGESATEEIVEIESISGEFNNQKILNRDHADTTNTVAIETDGGYYEVVLRSRDDTHQPGVHTSQTQEQWVLDLLDTNGSVIETTKATTDLSDEAIERRDEVGTYDFTGITAVRGRHVRQGTSINSIQPTSFTLKPTECIIDCETQVDVNGPSIETVLFKDERLIGVEGQQNTTSKIPVDIAPGRYEIFLVSKDSNHPDQASQPDEKWRLNGYDEAGKLVLETSPTSDLPDGKQADPSYVGGYTLTTAIASVEGQHAVLGGGPNSIEPATATFIPVDLDLLSESIEEENPIPRAEVKSSTFTVGVDGTIDDEATLAIDGVIPGLFIAGSNTALNVSEALRAGAVAATASTPQQVVTIDVTEDWNGIDRSTLKGIVFGDSDGRIDVDLALSDDAPTDGNQVYAKIRLTDGNGEFFEIKNDNPDGFFFKINPRRSAPPNADGNNDITVRASACVDLGRPRGDQCTYQERNFEVADRIDYQDECANRIADRLESGIDYFGLSKNLLHSTVCDDDDLDTSIHILIADLADPRVDPGISIDGAGTRQSSYTLRPISGHAQLFGDTVIAVNGNKWAGDQGRGSEPNDQATGPIWTTIVNGTTLFDNVNSAEVLIGFNEENNEARFFEKPQGPLPDFGEHGHDVVGSITSVVKNNECNDAANAENNYSAIGLKDERYLVMLSSSAGEKVRANRGLCPVFKALGVSDALRLDGGSATSAYTTSAGHLNELEGLDDLVFGNSRNILNAIAVRSV